MEGGLSEVTTLWRYTNRSLLLLLLLLLLVFADAWYQHRIYPRDAMLARVGLLAMARCLCVSVTSRRSIEAVRRFELVIDMEA